MSSGGIPLSRVFIYFSDFGDRVGINDGTAYPPCRILKTFDDFFSFLQAHSRLFPVELDRLDLLASPGQLKRISRMSVAAARWERKRKRLRAPCEEL